MAYSIFLCPCSDLLLVGCLPKGIALGVQLLDLGSRCGNSGKARFPALKFFWDAHSVRKMGAVDRLLFP